MRKVTCLLLSSLLVLTVSAQGVFSNHTNAALKKVIEDYPNRFSHIKGDRLAAHDLAVNYTSKVTIPGALNCTLTEYNQKEAYSWKCELFASANFEQAKGKFSELYRQIHNTIIKLEGEKPVILNGQYEMPEKEKKQTSIIFHFLPSSGLVQKLKVELLLQYDAGKWTIVLDVSEHEAQGDLAG